MQGTRWAVAIFVLCLGWTSVRGQQVLSVSAGGLTRSYTTSDLLGRPDVRTVSTRRDDAYRQAMTYQAIPLSSLFAGLGLDPDIPTPTRSIAASSTEDFPSQSVVG